MNFVDKLMRSAILLYEKGHFQNARTQLDEVLSFAPGHMAALSQKAEVCSAMGDHKAAIACIEAAQQINPGQTELLFGLGVEYFHVGRFVEALDIFDNLISIQPSLPVLHLWRGMTLADLGRNNEAFDEYRESLRLLPDYSEALTGLGSLLVKSRRLEEAEGYLKRAIEINPEDNGAYTSIARIYLLQGHSAQACDYFKKAFELSPGFRSAADNLLYSLCYPDTIIPEETAREHVVISSQLFPDQRKPGYPKIRTAHTPLRLGYLSGDFCTHSVAFFLEPILIHHDRKNFRVFCYSNRRVQDQTTLRIKSLDVQWRDVFDLSAEEAARQIAEDDIDILVDLSGHSSGNRLDVCALRPAPLQATWLGYPHSTGMSQIDYYLSDHLCDPLGMTDHLYSEQVWRLPHTFCCYLPPMEFPTVAVAPFRSNGVITFGSFNNFAKVTETVISLWARIMRAVPVSQLFLKSIGTESAGMQASLRDRFANCGIAPDRIVISPFADDSLQHLALYARVDIALDTYPYHGTTTTCESLWMGVPVVTLAGRTHLSRVGASLLSNIGLGELVADTPDRYCELAVELAHDPKRLLRLREELRGMMARSPLMDGPGVTRDLEDSLRVMYSACRVEKG